MANQTYDSNGNPIVVPGAIGAPNQQVADAGGILINPATQETLAAIKLQTDKLTFTGTKLQTDAELVTGDIEIGAVEIKDAMSATRLTVKSDGTDNAAVVTANVLPLPAGAATETTLAGVLTTTAFQGRINTLGQKTMAASTPVVLSSDQSAIPVTQSGAWTVTANAGTGLSTSLLALESTQAKLTIPQGAALGSNTQVLVGGSVTAAAPAYTTGQISPLSLTPEGALRVALAAGGSSVEQHTLESGSDLHVAGTTMGVAQAVRVVSSAPTLTAGQFASPNITTAGRLITDNSQVNQPITHVAVVDANNSTTTPLGAGASFTGATTEVLAFANISVIAFSDQDSATDGLRIEFSTDGTNWDASDEFTVKSTASSRVYTAGCYTRYFRIRYTNGATPQGVFRLQTLLHPNSPKNSNYRVSQAISPEDDSPIVKSVLAAQDPTTQNFIPLMLDSAGNLKVVQNTSAVSSPQTTASGESFAKRAYQTTYEVSLSTLNLEQNVILFRNPTASGKLVYISEITFTNTNRAGKNCILRVYSGPTVTANGTTLASTSMYVGGGASAASSLVTTGPTTSANGTKITAIAQTNEQARVDYDWGLLVNANNSLLITGTPGANNMVIVLNIIWTEVTL